MLIRRHAEGRRRIEMALVMEFGAYSEPKQIEQPTAQPADGAALLGRPVVAMPSEEYYAAAVAAAEMESPATDNNESEGMEELDEGKSALAPFPEWPSASSEQPLEDGLEDAMPEEEQDAVVAAAPVHNLPAAMGDHAEERKEELEDGEQAWIDDSRASIKKRDLSVQKQETRRGRRGTKVARRSCSKMLNMAPAP